MSKYPYKHGYIQNKLRALIFVTLISKLISVLISVQQIKELGLLWISVVVRKFDTDICNFVGIQAAIRTVRGEKGLALE